MRITLGNAEIDLEPSGLAVCVRSNIIVAALDASLFLQPTLFGVQDPINTIAERLAQVENGHLVLFVPNADDFISLPSSVSKRVIIISSKARSIRFPVLESASLEGIAFEDSWKPYSRQPQVTVGGLRDEVSSDLAFGVTDATLFLPLLGSSVTWPPHPAAPELVLLSECASQVADKSDLLSYNFERVPNDEES